MPAQTKPASRKNRDKESLYKPGKLSFWMAVTSVFLVISWVWMLWKDYDRPWKDYQADFYDKMVEMEEARLTHLKRELPDDEITALGKTRNAIAAGKHPDIPYDQAEIDRLKEELHALKKDRIAADRTFKGIKGLHAPANYEFVMARLRVKEIAEALEDQSDLYTQGDLESAKEEMEARKDELNRLAHDWYMAEIEYKDLVVDYQDLNDKIRAMERPLVEADKAIELAKEEYTKQQTKVEGVKQQYQRNQWRNAPFIDFISPTIKIRQVVLNDIHDNWNFATNVKVDRCMTCHLGIDIPDFSDDAVDALNARRREAGENEIDVPAYMREHSHASLIAGTSSPHPTERFGCTVCHHGVGWAVHFARVAHTPISAEQKAHWEEAHGWYKAKYIDYPMLPLEYTQGMCFKCHKAGLFYPPHYDESLDHGFVDDDPAGTVAQRLFSPDDERYLGPEDRKLTPLEVFGDYALPTAPPPVDGNPEKVAAETRLWLKEHMGAQEDGGRYRDAFVPTYGWRAASFERGYDTMTSYGCIGCHKIKDFGEQVGYEQPPRVGPTLTYVRDKMTRAFIDKWIRHPDMYRVDTPMPSFYEFTLKDHEWNYFPLDKDGKRVTLPVKDAHLLDSFYGDGRFSQALGVISTPHDEALTDIEIRALVAYLLNQRAPSGRLRSRSDPTDPGYDPLYTIDPPKGDPDKGRDLVNRLGCVACHIVPEFRTGYDAEGNAVYEEDGSARFDHEPPIHRGPRLTSLGSKLKDRRWLNAWLADPRHYTAHTRMPNMRIEDDKDLDGNVVYSAEQQRADIIDYLISFEDAEFDEIPTSPFKKSYEKIVREMWEEFFSKDASGRSKRPGVVEGEIGDLSDPNRLETVLAIIGERLMARKGCFGCHEVAGREHEMPIGTELTKEGIKDIHQLDFGRVPKYAVIDVAERDADGNKTTRKKTVPLAPHTRYDFFRTKITYPRVWDYGKQLRWVDKLRMPRFNLRMDDDLWISDADGNETKAISTRGAVTGVVLGLVEEPIKPGAIYQPGDYERDIIAGRKVVKRYGCNNCHTIEGKQGYLWGKRVEQGMDPATLPPNLFAQGWRTRSEWLVRFLQHPIPLRPIVEVHMPKFGLNDDEAIALANYFLRLAGSDQRMVIPQPGSRLEGVEYDQPVKLECRKNVGDVHGVVSNAVEEARTLFNVINCNKCHLPKGMPGADPNDGGVAPSFGHSAERLRHAWVRMLLNNPQHLINGTKMPNVYPLKRDGGRSCDLQYQVFEFHLRDDPEWQGMYNSGDPALRAKAEAILANVQMEALTDYVLYHYTPPSTPK